MVGTSNQSVPVAWPLIFAIQTWLEKPPFIDLILPVETPFSSDIWQLATFDATRGTIVDGQIMLNPYYINPY